MIEARKMSLIFFSIIFFSRTHSNTEKINYYNSLVPVNMHLRKRILTTICCEDCRNLPKVENAGNIITESSGLRYQLMHNGLKILPDCYYGNWMSVLIELLHGHHEPQEEKPFHEILKYMPSKAVMLELGSYWGYYSLWFQQQVPEARNFLIEPDPKNIIAGKNNFKLNNMQGIFTQAMIGATSLNDKEFVDWDYNKHIVPQINIDDFAYENHIDFISLLHSDIQGAEIDMLKGCKKMIAQNRIGYFFISTHRGTHQECLKILTESNLEILLSVTREESFSADGLIIAKLPSLKGPDSLEVSRRTQEFCTIIDRL